MKKDMGCPYREWGWHDGGPDYFCTRDHNKGYCCEDSYSDHHQCAIVKEELAAHRERFETWARAQGFHTSRAIHKDYENSKLNWMWKAWLEASIK